MEIDEEKTITTIKEVRLNGSDIIDLLQSKGILPDDCTASVKFYVPGGGDYSNMSLDITNDDPVTVFCKETLRGDKND